jgi:Flp pilus assembly protein TadG
MNLPTGLRNFGSRPTRELDAASPLKRNRAKSWTVVRLLRARLRPAEEGGALVEMALVLPILAMMVLGLMSVATMFMNYLDLTEATGAGAQYLAEIRTSSTNPCQDTYNAIIAAAPSLTTTNISLSFSFDNGAKTTSGDTCAGYQQYLVQGEPTSVTATYPCNLSFYGVNYDPGGCTLSATSSEYEY